MGVKSNLPEVRARRQAVFAGDEGRVKAQKDLGKLTARRAPHRAVRRGQLCGADALNEDAGVVAGFGHDRRARRLCVRTGLYGGLGRGRRRAREENREGR